MGAAVNSDLFVMVIVYVLGLAVYCAGIGFWRGDSGEWEAELVVGVIWPILGALALFIGFLLAPYALGRWARKRRQRG